MMLGEICHAEQVGEYDLTKSVYFCILAVRRSKFVSQLIQVTSKSFVLILSHKNVMHINNF
jgi:hypothetical protein